MVGFKPWQLSAAAGAVWALDPQFPLLVRCDPDTRAATVAVQLPTVERDDAGQDPWPAGPRALTAGLGALWLALPRARQLARVPFDESTVELVDVPIMPTALTAGSEAIYVAAGSGDRRLLVVKPDGEQRLVELGVGLALVAAAPPWLWLVDDAAGEVLVLDESTLSVVHRFERLAAPGLLLARGDSAWYLSTAEAQTIGPSGRRERAMVIGRGGFEDAIMQMSARTGAATMWPHQRALHPVGAIDDSGLWLAGPQQDDLEDDPLSEANLRRDPVSTLHRYDFDGRLQQTLNVPGQLDALTLLNGEVWVAGFQRSRQDFVVRVLTNDGAIHGEVDLSSIDVSPWLPTRKPPAAPVPMDEFVARARDALTSYLTTQQQWSDRFGDTWDEPPISRDFRLLRVEATDRALAVIFHWGDADTTYGWRYEIDDEDLTGGWWGDTPESWAGHAMTSIEEDLLAGGYGINKAVKSVADGISWLHWPPPNN